MSAMAGLLSPYLGSYILCATSTVFPELCGGEDGTEVLLGSLQQLAILSTLTSHESPYQLLLAAKRSFSDQG